MNAYEIADELDGRLDHKAANMLRQQADRIAELEKKIYRQSHEGFSTIEEVIAKHEAIPSRKEAIDKAREWLKDYRIDAIVVEPFTKPLSDEEIETIYLKTLNKFEFARAIEERHGIK